MTGEEGGEGEGGEGGEEENCHPLITSLLNEGAVIKMIKRTIGVCFAKILHSMIATV